MKKFLVLLAWMIIFSQTNNYFHDAKTIAMGGGTVSIKDMILPAFTNPSVLSHFSKTHIIANTIIPFNALNIFTIGGIGITYFTGEYGTVGFTAEFFQVDYEDRILQSENTYIISHGFYLMEDVSSSLSFGYNIRMFHLVFNNFENTGKTEETLETIFDVGFHGVLYKHFQFGAFIKNLTNQKVGYENDLELVREFQVGISYQPYDGVVTSFDLSKEIGFDNRSHFGVDYRVFQSEKTDFYVRFGIVSQPSQFSFGFQLDYKSFRVLYGMMTHTIGQTQQIGFAYVFN